MPSFCTDCGFELRGGERYCPECGASVRRYEQQDGTGAGDATGDRQTPDSETASAEWSREQASDHGHTHASGRGDRGAYRAAVAGALGWFVMFVGSLAFAPENVGQEPSAMVYVFIFSWIAWLASIVAMYADLRSMDRYLWGTRPVLWVVAVVLLYVITFPLYVHKRRRAPDLE